MWLVGIIVRCEKIEQKENYFYFFFIIIHRLPYKWHWTMNDCRITYFNSCFCFLFSQSECYICDFHLDHCACVKCEVFYWFIWCGIQDCFIFDLIFTNHLYFVRWIEHGMKINSKMLRKTVAWIPQEFISTDFFKNAKTLVFLFFIVFFFIFCGQKLKYVTTSRNLQV